MSNTALLTVEETQVGAANRTQRSKHHAISQPDNRSVSALAQPMDQPKVEAAITQAMIAEAAYYRAAARNFSPGHELDDWLASEEQINAQLHHGSVWPAEAVG